MDRRNNNRYNRHPYGDDHDRYEDYSREGARYHRDPNLSNAFERDYIRNREQWHNEQERFQPQRGYQEAAKHHSSERMRRDDNNFSRNAGEHWRDRDYHLAYDRNSDRDRYSRFGPRNYRDDSFSGAHSRFTDSGFRHFVFNDEYGTGRGTSFEDYGTMGGNTFGRDRGNITGDNAYNPDRRY